MAELLILTEPNKTCPLKHRRISAAGLIILSLPVVFSMMNLDLAVSCAHDRLDSRSAATITDFI